MAAEFNLLLTAEDKDIDAFGHVNNTVYASWCQRAALAHSESLGLSLESFKELSVAMVIHRAEYDYRQPVFVSDKISIVTELKVVRAGLRLQRSFQIYAVEREVVVAEGVWQLVCTNLATGRPQKMPQHLATIYSQL